MKCRIREKSLIARVAAWKLDVPNVAIVIGNTIHLHNASREDLINNSAWFNHELAHIRQFHQHGFISFIVKYLWESIKNGYRNNKFEVEARAAENEEGWKKIKLELTR